MKRREFLVLSLFAPLASRAGLLDCPKPEQRRQVVRAGLAAAKAAGKPLLVLVAPRDGAWIRGHALGQWLNHGGDSALADVAQVHVIVARTEDVRAERPSLPAGTDPTLWFLWGEDSTPLQVTLQHADSDRRRGTDADPSIDRNIKALRDALRIALGATREGRVAACRPLPAPAARLTPQEVDAHAARLADQPDMVARLAAAARQRVVSAPIPGSYWATGHGCGEVVEGVPHEEQQLVKCGMGFVPERSRRFVRFFACEV